QSDCVATNERIPRGYAKRGRSGRRPRLLADGDRELPVDGVVAVEADVDAAGDRGRSDRVDHQVSAAGDQVLYTADDEVRRRVALQRDGVVARRRGHAHV